jgi:hypothetical protein
MVIYSDEYVQKILRDSEEAFKQEAFVKSPELAPYYKRPSSSEEERHTPNVKVTGSIPV